MTARSDMSAIGGAAPVAPSERYTILDILRGFALLGIAVANFPEFSLYTFLPADAAGAMPTARLDSVVRYLQYVFVDGKFYTVFSLLFGIGFSIIISNAAKRGADGLRVFYRRMVVLMLIGFLHLMFIWSGDILMLYALLGMLLPLFRKASDRTLLMWAAALLLLPVLVDAVTSAAGVSLSAPVVALQRSCCARYGITDANFAYWLRDARSYAEVFDFLVQGALVRVQEFIDGNRYFKVMGLFLIGFCIGRRRLYADLERHRAVLVRIASVGLLFGLPLSCLYAWSAVSGRPFGVAVHSLLYLVSVYPVGFAYVACLCLFFMRCPGCRLFRLIAAPGRMALTNYIGQSLCGMLIFYGIGFGLGADMGLSYVVLIAAGVWLVGALFSSLWLSAFRFGPLEWVWRMLTYGKVFPLRICRSVAETGKLSGSIRLFRGRGLDSKSRKMPPA